MCIRVSLQRSLEFIDPWLTTLTEVSYKRRKKYGHLILYWKGQEMNFDRLKGVANSVAVYLHNTIRLQTAGTVYT